MLKIGAYYVSNVPALENLVKEFQGKFKCKRCGECCPKATAGVAVTHDDVRKLANRLGMASKVFERAYVGYFNEKQMVIKQPCPFYKPEGCQAYNIRPNTCRLFPMQTLWHLGYRRIAVSWLCPNAAEQLEAFERSVMV